MEQSGRRYEPNGIRSLAIHEAGHAVASGLLRVLLKSVNIWREEKPDGSIRYVERDIVAGAVVEPGGLRAGVVGDLLDVLQSTNRLHLK